MDIEDRIGVSTHVLPGVTLSEAIKRVADAGFRTFEIVPSDFQAVVGFPDMVPNAGVWPRTFGKAERETLGRELEIFEIVTVHTPHLGGLNIASINPGIREESQRQYIECIEFAADVGAGIVTIHPGILDQDSARGWERRLHEHNVDFARQALALAHKYDMRMGYESAEGDPRLEEIIQGVDDPRFGLHLDVCNSYVWEIFPKFNIPEDAHAEIERLIDTYIDRIPEVHAHGAFGWWGETLTHQSFRRNNVVDWKRVVRTLKVTGFGGPFVFEIQSKDIDTVLADCVEAKEALIRYWNES